MSTPEEDLERVDTLLEAYETVSTEYVDTFIGKVLKVNWGDGSWVVLSAVATGEAHGG